MRCRLKSFLRTGFVGIIATLALSAASQADAIQPTITYSTSAFISDPSRIEGAPVITFQGIDHGTFTSPEPFTSGQTINPVPAGFGVEVPLGSLVSALPAPGTTTTYNGVPFDIMIHVDAINGAAPAVPLGHVSLEGFLSGKVSSDGTNTVSASFMAFASNSPQTPDMVAGFNGTAELTYELLLPHQENFRFAPSSTPGRVDLSGVFVAEKAVPEPTSIAVFAMLCVSLAARRYSRRRLPGEGLAK